MVDLRYDHEFIYCNKINLCLMSILLFFTCDSFCDKEEDNFYVIFFALGELKTLPKDFFQ
jgi:hypothetical protein